MLFKKKNKQAEEIENLSEEVKRYKDLYEENKRLLNQLLNETIEITMNSNSTKGA